MSGELPQETLDPDDWPQQRALAHRALDDALDYLQQVRQRPVWQPAPAEVAAKFQAPLPRAPQGAEAAYRDYSAWIAPWQMGNTHPRFWGWFMGNGTAFGALGDLLAATLNPNVGGGNHVANQVETQVVDWCKEIVGLPLASGGLLVSGASMANFVGLAVARTAAAGVDVRAQGVAALPQPLRFYASTEVHSCIQKALELLGHGAQSLHRIAVDDHYRMDPDALARAVAADRAAGCKPCAVIGSAGTINTGSVDDLDALAAFCRREALWFHVDGAIGAVLALAPSQRARVRGMEQADSVALDLHKWLHIPFEAGCALIRDRAAHRATFSLTPEYLKHAQRGLAGGADWFSDYGLQLSRGFRALKVWLSFKEHGLDKYGRLIEQNIAQAAWLAERVRTEPELELLVPPFLNIVCFRYRVAGAGQVELNALNEELLIRLHERGVVAPSYTTLRGNYCLRAAIVNHRTRSEDLVTLIDEVLATGRALRNAGARPAPAHRPG
jgi:glutamate/tyrosine decarboxylase-like PLP-dependent enzyme